MASVILNMWKQFQKGETLKLFKGSENFMRDFVYVDDIVKINLHFLRFIQIWGFQLRNR